MATVDVVVAAMDEDIITPAEPQPGMASAKIPLIPACFRLVNARLCVVEGGFTI